MSLVKKPTMTEKKIAANRRNASQSPGPVTAEGRERIAAAHFRHGFYAKTQEEALARLGEDPAAFEELRQGLYEEFTPAGTLQIELVDRLARVLWLVERADRSFEGEALRRARSAEHGRDNRLHARMMRLKMTVETLRSLARSVAEWHYVTTQEDLEVMKKLHQEGATMEMGEIALDLFLQLQTPGTDEDGVSEEEKTRGVVNSIRSIFGIAPMQEDVGLLTPSGERLIVRAHPPGDVNGPADGDEDEESEKDDRYPKITEEDWIARERARKLLRNILSRQAEACEEQRKDLLKESLAGPSPFELAAEITPSPADVLMTRRLQDANMREVRRLTNMLLKIKGQKRKMEPPESTGEDPEGHDVEEKKER